MVVSLLFRTGSIDRKRNPEPGKLSPGLDLRDEKALKGTGLPGTIACHAAPAVSQMTPANFSGNFMPGSRQNL